MRRCYVLILALVGFFWSCEDDDDNQPPADVFFINDCSERSGSTPLVLPGENEIGDIDVTFIPSSGFGGIIEIDYDNDREDLLYKSIIYDIETSFKDIPQNNGIPNTAHFTFKQKNTSLGRVVLSVITGGIENFQGDLFIAALADFSEREDLPSDSVRTSILRTHNAGDPSYFKVTLAGAGSFDGEYPAFCLQGDQNQNDAVDHNTLMIYSSLSTNRATVKEVVDDANKIELINWIINQEPSRWGPDADGADIQMAIWELIETTAVPGPSGARIQGVFDPAIVDRIVEDAEDEGVGFKPEHCGDKEFVILHKGPIDDNKNPATGTFNVGAYSQPDYQVTGIVMEIRCKDISDKAWGFGIPFARQPGSYYFNFCVE